MLIIPSRARPHNLSRFIAACINTGASIPAWVRLDEDDEYLPQYAALSIPRHWEIVIGPRVPLSEVYNEAYREMPETSHWVFVADDVVPVTQNWDRLLIDVAGTDGMAVPAGGETTGGCPHFVLGGELVRSVGWLALPGLKRLFIDTCWETIASSRGVLRHCPDITLKHHHFSNHLALFDATYKKSTEIKKNDRQIYDKWFSEQRRSKG